MTCGSATNLKSMFLDDLVPHWSFIAHHFFQIQSFVTRLLRSHTKVVRKRLPHVLPSEDVSIDNIESQISWFRLLRWVPLSISKRILSVVQEYITSDQTPCSLEALQIVEIQKLLAVVPWNSTRFNDVLNCSKMYLSQFLKAINPSVRNSCGSALQTF